MELVNDNRFKVLENFTSDSSDEFNYQSPRIMVIDNSDSSDESRIVQKQLFWYDIRNFPDSLLIEILAKLPGKSIFMFKCVCKHWKILISEPFFYRYYHSILNSNSNAEAVSPFRLLPRYSRLPNIKEFVNRLGPEIHSSSSEFSVLSLSTLEEQRRYGRFRVLDISNGLILCCPRSSVYYYICDPFTRLWISIRRRGPLSHREFREGLITRVNEDHMLTGYTVVRVADLESRSNYLNVEMFSSETRNWIVYSVPCAIPIQLKKFSGCPIHCYGALNWPVRYHNGTYGLLAFDPYKNNNETYGFLDFDPYTNPNYVRPIPFPEDRDLKSDRDHFGMSQLCGESQGTLRYFEVARDPTQLYLLRMWAMKDYETGEWCCEFKVRRSDIYSSDLNLSNWLLDGCRFYPLSFHPLNPNVVYLECMNPKRIVSCDVMNRRMDFACKQTDSGYFISTGSGIPFVLPRWPVLVSGATVNSKIKGVKCRK